MGALDTTLKAFGETTGKSGKALGESHHSLESKWTGKSSKKIDLNNLIIKFVTSLGEASTLDSGLQSFWSGKSSGYGLASYLESLSSSLGGKSGKSGLKDKKEDNVHDLFDIFVSLWLKSLDKKETIDAILSRIVVDGSFLDGLDMIQLLDELQKELANLPPKSFLLSGKSGKSSPGHFVVSSLFSGKSGKSGLEDKTEDILELLEDVLAQVVEVLLELLPSSQPSFQPSVSVFPSSQPSVSAEP